MGTIRLSRVYDHETPTGRGFLVDRLWPRGIRREDLPVEDWLKEVAPSTELRKWFGHDPARWSEFQRRYRAELRDHSDALDRIQHLAQSGVVTLVYSAQDEQHNDAVVLRDVLLGDA